VRQMKDGTLRFMAIDLKEFFDDLTSIFKVFL
jgi:hypothetical protein